ncbi:MAG: S1/P1 nuclease, partial [Calditrichaeota bacterium]|nr:S1/P1 nuclease [Calditrichota bacterium]
MRSILVSAMLITFCFGHGKTGHRIVGQIAESLLSDQAKHKIDQLLGHHRLAYIGNWADEMRSNPEWRHASPWHYVDLPAGTDYQKSEKNPKGDIIAKIIEFTNVLKSNQSDQISKENALRFLIHFIADLHQPLHVGNGKDQGGNAVKVTWFGESSNLHRVWDSDLIDDEQLSYSEYSEKLTILYNDQFNEWKNSELMDWVKESQALHESVYDIGNGKLGYDYIYKNKTISEKRLA